MTVYRDGSEFNQRFEKGELVLAPASISEFKPSARGQILGAETRAMPALSNGWFFARDKRKLVSVKFNP